MLVSFLVLHFEIPPWSGRNFFHRWRKILEISGNAEGFSDIRYFILQIE